MWTALTVVPTCGLRQWRLRFSEAAAWLEQVDADLFSLAVYYLASKDRAARIARSPARLA